MGRSSFFTIKSSYFLALAIFDSIVLLNVILLKGLPNMVESSSFYVNIFTTAHPMMNMSWTMSIYLTLFLTLERYFALCWSGRRTANIKKTKKIVVVIFLMAMVYNIPKCLEYTLKSNTIRTDDDPQDHRWTSILKNDSRARFYFGSDHFEALKSKPDNAESGTYDGELHLKSIKYLLQVKLD